jgi:hypothetical protein
MLALFFGLSTCSEMHTRVPDGHRYARTARSALDSTNGFHTIPSPSDEYDRDCHEQPHDKEKLCRPEDEYLKDRRDADPDPNDRNTPDATPDWGDYDELWTSPWGDILNSTLFVVVAFAIFSLLCIVYGRCRRQHREGLTADIEEPLINE